MSRPKILLQLDPDRHASAFDAIVALDAGVDHLLPFHGVQPEHVRDLVHGAIFTRSPRELSNTAIFIGGSNVTAGEGLLAAVQKAFFGPLRVSVLLDANGANTTAAAAVLAAGRHATLENGEATVLAATGPVGRRAVRLLARCGARVRVVSRSQERAEQVCQDVRRQVPKAHLSAHSSATPDALVTAIAGAKVVIAAGAAGVELLATEVLRQTPGERVLIDLNAIPPAGIAGIEPTDKATQRDNQVCYGAIGVGGTKMRIHATAIARLFESSDQVLDADEVYDIGRVLEA